MNLFTRTALGTMLLGLTATLTACGGARVGAQVGAIPEWAQSSAALGSDEQEAAAHLDALTLRLTSNMEDPQAAIAAVSAYLEDNRQALVENGRALEEKLAALDGQEKRAYEYQLDLFMREPLYAWRDARAAFAERHEEQAEALEAVVDGFDGVVEEEGVVEGDNANALESEADGSNGTSGEVGEETGTASDGSGTAVAPAASPEASGEDEEPTTGDEDSSESAPAPE